MTSVVVELPATSHPYQPHILRHNAGGKELTANVRSPDLAFLDEVVSSTGDEVSLALETEVSEHHSSREHESNRIGLVGAHDVLTDVSASRLEEGVFLW